MRAILLAGVAAILACAPAAAGEPWIAPGDVQVRHDIELLVDEGVMNLPISSWPIAVSDLAAALKRAGAPVGGSDRHTGQGLTPSQAAAVRRLKRLTGEFDSPRVVEARVAARPNVLRGFEDTPREEAELRAWASGFFGERWGARLEVGVVGGPDDNLPVRLDGSYLAGKFGNWIVTLGAQERWWGSGWEGSLLLSNNARPVPTIALDRAVSEPFESKWLRWIGPWRLTTFMGYMDGDRGDYDHPLLFGLRVSARPLKGLEVSLERTAQWCGDGRSCNFDDFWNLFWGNDNAGENVDPEDEPGNQLAGWDIRWASPIGDAPYALYFQHTGETIDNKIPRPYRSLDLAGAEVWGESESGSSWRLAAEWANTRCGGTENGEKLWDCAYNNNVYNVSGYRYYGRPVGHAMDGDGEMYSMRFVHVGADEVVWTVLARYTEVNQGGAMPDERHSVAPGPEQWWSLDLIRRWNVGSGWIEAGMGGDYRERDWNDTDPLLARFAVTWRQQFQ
jgi:hypothetical protein